MVQLEGVARDLVQFDAQSLKPWPKLGRELCGARAGGGGVEGIGAFDQGASARWFFSTCRWVSLSAINIGRCSSRALHVVGLAVIGATKLDCFTCDSRFLTPTQEKHRVQSRQLHMGLQAGLEQLVDAYASAHGVSMQLALITPARQHMAASGATSSDRFLFGSGTKPYTATQLLQAVDAEALTLEEPAARLIDAGIQSAASPHAAARFVDLFGPRAARVTGRRRRSAPRANAAG